ncbi:GntR family transcriptional regulator [Microtetraspora sp. NBRC 16547]|uniref:GntR family transcriptional regulator n=1 Tax=Microtetraspora sp. NBRC 16547 TaxID=3030993 RepID=UPI0024A06DD1|nr:GntR family transcriptional regulator [Microtetraspora sp. NBRC 16547]GLW98079.1 GntR family transcriptional regulator [Microtetraspora sp. NBRC 16547]
MTATAEWASRLSAARPVLERASTAELVAGVLRENVIEGSLPPGTRLSEEIIGQALGVSRNTLREAFRLLSHENLLVHEFHRGMFVRRLTAADVVDIYRMRRPLEAAGLRAAGAAPAEAVREVGRRVEEGRAAAEAGDWVGVGTANMRFHRAVAALLGSRRVDESMARILAELRLAFHMMGEPRPFHEPYLDDNTRIVALLAEGEYEQAATVLLAYLDTAESQLLATYGERSA